MRVEIGCICMYNEDIMDLYSRVGVGHARGGYEVIGNPESRYRVPLAPQSP
jgi:hypothetical protein